MDSTLDLRPGWDLEWHLGTDRSAHATADGGSGGSVGLVTQTLLAAESFGAGPEISWAAGFQYAELDFSRAASLPLPSQFRSEGLGLDAIWRPNPAYGALVEALPAFSGQGSALSAGAFNVTGTAEALWLAAKGLLVEGGVQFDTLGKYSVYPCGGIVFGSVSGVSVQLLFPQPRISYALNSSATCYLGANYEVQSFRTSGSFGNAFSRPELNHAAFTAEEFSWGPGFTLRVREAVTFDVGAGMVSDRRFDFFRAGIAVVPKSAACIRASIVAIF
jgi:hypothetical protein